MSEFYVHPKALVETERIGEGTRIWAFAHVMSGVTLGSNCNVGDHSFIEDGVSIADNVTIKNGNCIWKGVCLEEGVFVGPRVFFTNDLYPRSGRMASVGARYDDESWIESTVVCRGASLGAGSVIIAGNTIGEYAMVAAGAVVTHDVAPYALVLGNPARIRGWVCRCGLKLAFGEGLAVCDTCGSRYRQNEEGVAFLG